MSTRSSNTTDVVEAQFNEGLGEVREMFKEELAEGGRCLLKQLFHPHLWRNFQQIMVSRQRGSVIF